MRSPSLLPPLPRCSLLFALVAVTLLAAGCATRRPAPVEDRAVSRQPPRALAAAPAPSEIAMPPPGATYTVKRGDTLHQIALDNGLDYRELAAWNNIENVNRILPGQVLRLAAPGEAPAPPPQDAAAGAAGVTTTPLRSVPGVVEGRPGVAASAPAAIEGGVGTAPSAPAAIATPGSAAARATTAPSSAAARPGGAIVLKTSPKAIKEAYSEQAVRDLNFAASAGPAPPDALALAAPGGVRSDARTEPRLPAVPAAPSPSQPAPPDSIPPAATAPGASGAAMTGDPDRLDWSWPARGRIVAGFSETANLKGIDIAGTAGEPVRASAPGRVVYAGSGLRGYGKLIIIKHNATFLSAYAHNREILVKEGQQVTRGQKIGEMGNSDADQVKLHFEIRRHGKPMDPTKYLPPA